MVRKKNPEKIRKLTTKNLKKMDFLDFFITDEYNTDEYFGTNTEAEVPVENLFSLYNHITPPKREDRTAEANGNNTHSNRLTATASEQTRTQQTQNTNGNNSHSNGLAATASVQTQIQQTQSTNGNNSLSNGFAASEQTRPNSHAQDQLSQMIPGLGASSTLYSTHPNGHTHILEAEVTVKTANEIAEQKREDRTPRTNCTSLLKHELMLLEHVQSEF